MLMSARDVGLREDHLNNIRFALQETPMPMIDVYAPADLFPVGTDQEDETC